MTPPTPPPSLPFRNEARILKDSTWMGMKMEGKGREGKEKLLETK
jgi:hypothetical protein